MNEKQIYLELLKQKFTERQKLETDITKVLIMYLAVIGVLIKFSLDVNSTYDLKNMLAIIGILVTLIGFVQCHLISKVRKIIDADVSELNNKLGNPLLNQEHLTVKYFVPTILAFLFIVIIGFIYILLI